MEEKLNTHKEKETFSNNKNYNEKNQNFKKNVTQKANFNYIKNNNKDTNPSISKEKFDLTEKTMDKNLSINQLSNKNEKRNTFQKKKRLSQDNFNYKGGLINNQEKKEEKISEIKKEETEKGKLKSKLTRKSVEVTSRMPLIDNFLERMAEEEKRSKMKQEKLIERIKNERAKKVEEIEKPLDFKIKPTKIDKKFNKIYQEMIKKEEKAKEKLIAFSNFVNQYELKECVFQPNFNKKENDNNKKRKKRLSSSEITQRLYNDDLKGKQNKRESLELKYKLSFKPTIGEKSLELAQKRKKRVEKKDKETEQDKNNLEIENNEKEKMMKNKTELNINAKEENKENIQKNIKNK